MEANKKYLRNRRLGVYADLRQFGIILAAAGIISFFLDDSVSVGAAALAITGPVLWVLGTLQRP